MPIAYDPFDEIRREASGTSLIPPQVVADNAAKGLALRKQFGRGGTEIGLSRAEELVARTELTPHTIKRMVSYFARHEVDKRGKNYGNEHNPSAGYIAWLLWGGDEGRAWAVAMKGRAYLSASASCKRTTFGPITAEPHPLSRSAGAITKKRVT